MGSRRQSRASFRSIRKATVADISRTLNKAKANKNVGFSDDKSEHLVIEHKSPELGLRAIPEKNEELFSSETKRESDIANRKASSVYRA